MSDTSPAQKLVELQSAIAKVCLDARVQRGVAATACLLIATSIARDSPHLTHADLVEMLRSMEELPMPTEFSLVVERPAEPLS